MKLLKAESARFSIKYHWEHSLLQFKAAFPFTDGEHNVASETTKLCTNHICKCCLFRGLWTLVHFGFEFELYIGIGHFIFTLQMHIKQKPSLGYFAVCPFWGLVMWRWLFTIRDILATYCMFIFMYILDLDTWPLNVTILIFHNWSVLLF